MTVRELGKVRADKGKLGKESDSLENEERGK